MEYLIKVFNWLCSLDKTKPNKCKKMIGYLDISKALMWLNHKQTKAECKLYVWEVDDNLDGYVDWTEFIKGYKRCQSDTKGLMPRRLYNMTMFLMYDSSDFSGEVTVEETLQLLFVRNGRERLDKEIKALFGDNIQSKDGDETTITFKTFVHRLEERSIREFISVISPTDGIQK
jgi:Ca2+-binding EF-hand superfamily protein